MKYFNLIGVSALSLLAFSSHAENVLTVDDLKISAGGEETVLVYLDNSDAMTGIGFELILPEGVSYVENDTEDRMYASKKAYFNVEDNTFSNCVKFACYSTTMELDANDSGSILSITLSSTVDYNGPLYVNGANGMYGTEAVSVKFPIGKLGTNGYSTYSSSEDILIEGATAYYGKIDGDVLNLIEVADNKVESNQGVVLKGTEGAVVYGTSIALDSSPVNDLKASGTGKNVSGVHVLSTDSKGTGFFKYSGTYIGNGKAYLESASAARISFADDVTGIENVEANGAKTVFNLQGQMVKGAANGISIVNGKKVMY